MARAALPPHLDHKSALAIILAEEDCSIAYQTVQSIRQVHDRSYQRWPPHINLLYPFLAHPSSQIDGILERVHDVLQDIPAFQARFSDLEHFTHSKKSATLFLHPDSPTTSESIIQIQHALQAGFPECNHDTRTFVPHMTLGQAGGEKAVQQLVTKVESKILNAMNAVDPDEEELRAQMCRAGIEEPSTPTQNATKWAMQWKVSRVVILERQGFDDPFEVVGEVKLKE